ncbi:TolC family protein [Novosphingobium sp.]|jgi:outer membrane protein TolC|uniref:TolC family protein n=1 Tax=Novosphingobium sp. TaxID=1874826 RepID=UPI002FE313B6
MAGSSLRKVVASGAAGFTACLLSACAHYTPLPLPASAPLAQDVGGLREAQAPGALLSVEQVVTLALANNPDLRAARLRRGMAGGQTKQAGILPNPSISGAFLPLLSGVGTVPAWNFGLSQDIKALITYKSRRRAAQDSEQQVAADIVWQEWQVAGKARQLAADLIVSENSRPVYLEQYEILLARNARLEKALAAGNVTLATIAPDRVALQVSRSALQVLDQNQLALRHQLNALLGLAPDATVEFAQSVDLPPFDPAAVRAALPSLQDRRPDLLALRLGYAAADEGVRQAVLSQFPDLVLGGSVASDNAKVINGGPNVTLGLPIFDRNQGNVAIANATRAQLHAEYEARLAAATGEVGAMLSEAIQLTTQLESTLRDLPAAREAARRAQSEFQASRLDERSYLDLMANRFAKEQEVLTLQLALLDRQIAIQTLTGAALPSVELPGADLPSDPAGVRP